MPQAETTTSTQSNAGTVGAIYRALGDGDVPAVLALFAPDIAWRISGRNPLSGAYTGHDEVLGFFQAIGERSNGTFTLDVLDLLEGDANVVVALVTEHAERNGARLADAAVHLWRVEAGRAASFQGFTSDDHEQDAFWS
jgi:ketosteroid isomerase-like protein